jgi:hypothetical protein
LSEHEPIYKNILEYTNATMDNCLNAGGYLTWYAGMPYVWRGGGGGGAPARAMAETPRSKEDVNATFRVAVLPGLASYLDTSEIPGPCRNVQNISLASLPPNLMNSSTLLQCRLVNTTYHVDFEYTDGNQTIVVNAPRTPSDTVVERLVHMYGPLEVEDACAALQPYDTSSRTPAADVRPCRIDTEALQRVAYQSILDSFFGVIGGPVSRREFGFRGNILSTTLLEMPELGFLTDYARAHEHLGGGEETNLHIEMGDSGRADIAGLIEPDDTVERMTLAGGLEQMFLNLTVSLMSSPTFQ